MGFSKNASERAVLAVKNSSVDSAMNWLLQHLDDKDINEPIVSQRAKEEDTFDPKLVTNLTQMGFTADQAKYALKQTNSNLDRAVDWLFSHPDFSPEENKRTESTVEVDNRPPKYRLIGAITHLGASTTTGHYVAHLLKEGKWILFNDSKVSVASKEKLHQAYLYFFRKV